MQAHGAPSILSEYLPYDSAILLSSTCGIWSQQGASHYAAANSSLDGLAIARQAAGLSCCSLQLGPFADTGMAANHTVEFEKMGLRSLKPSILPDLEIKAGVSCNQIFVGLHLKHFVPLHTINGAWDFVQDTLTIPDKAEYPIIFKLVDSVQQADNRKEMTKLRLANIMEIVQNLVQNIIGEGIGDFDQFPAGAIDSLAALELASSLSSSLDLDLPVTLIFDYPSVSSLSKYIYNSLNLGKESDDSLDEIEPSILTNIADFEAPPGIAICCPCSSGGVPSLTDCLDSVTLVPYNRWELNNGKVRSRLISEML